MQSGDKALEMEQVRHIVHSNGMSREVEGNYDVFIKFIVNFLSNSRYKSYQFNYQGWFVILSPPSPPSPPSTLACKLIFLSLSIEHFVLHPYKW